MEYVKFQYSVQIPEPFHSMIIHETANSGPGSFVVQFGDHFRAGDHLRSNLGIISSSGIICGPVQSFVTKTACGFMLHWGQCQDE